MTDKVIVRTVSMYSQEWDIVDKVDQRYGYRSTSAALRYIVNRYASNLQDDEDSPEPEGDHDDQ
jgi:hypothetical protein